MRTILGNSLLSQIIIIRLRLNHGNPECRFTVMYVLHENYNYYFSKVVVTSLHALRNNFAIAQAAVMQE